MADEGILVTGMVLNTMPMGEFDKRISILTKELGKVSVFVRGAKSPKSTLGAASDPFVMGEFFVAEGRGGSYSLYRANIKDYFSSIREDYDMVCYGSYFLEVADYYGRGMVDGKDTLNLLYVTLKAMERKNIPLPLVRCIYELKTLCINGEAPDVFSCAGCAKTEKTMYLNIKKSRVFCENCKGKGDDIFLDDKTLYAMRFVEKAPLNNLYSFSLGEAVRA